MGLCSETKMAMTSSITHSPNSSQSLNPLTVAHKIYFADVATPTASSFHAASPTKKMKAASAIQHPPRCQVDACNVDLTHVKAYYSRHKVCIMHSKSAVVTVGGVHKRFCQQCSRV